MPESNLPTSVDITQLSQAVGWLRGMQGFVETHGVGHLPKISEQMGVAELDVDGVDHKLTGKASVFGSFYSGYGMQEKHDATFRAVRESLTQLAKHLGEVADATGVIADRYRTAEERNRANVEDIERAMDAGRYTPIDPAALAGGRDPEPPKAAHGPGDPTVLAPGPLDGGGSGGGSTIV